MIKIIFTSKIDNKVNTVFKFKDEHRMCEFLTNNIDYSVDIGQYISRNRLINLGTDFEVVYDD